MQRKYIPEKLLLLCLIIFLSGCSESLQQLMDIDRNDKAIRRELSSGEKNFDLLLRDVERGRVLAGAEKADIIKRYGKPVLESFDEASELDKLLYRYPTKYFAAPKVYLYFNREQRLVRLELVNVKEGLKDAKN